MKLPREEEIIKVINDNNMHLKFSRINDYCLRVVGATTLRNEFIIETREGKENFNIIHLNEAKVTKRKTYNKCSGHQQFKEAKPTLYDALYVIQKHCDFCFDSKYHDRKEFENSTMFRKFQTIKTA